MVTIVLTFHAGMFLLEVDLQSYEEISQELIALLPALHDLIGGSVSKDILGLKLSILRQSLT